jgi:hypothetical protein
MNTSSTEKLTEFLPFRSEDLFEQSFALRVPQQEKIET